MENLSVKTVNVLFVIVFVSSVLLTYSFVRSNIILEVNDIRVDSMFSTKHQEQQFATTRTTKGNVSSSNTSFIEDLSDVKETLYEREVLFVCLGILLSVVGFAYLCSTRRGRQVVLYTDIELYEEEEQHDQERPLRKHVRIGIQKLCDEHGIDKIEHHLCH